MRCRELALLLLVGAGLLTPGCRGNSSAVPCSSLLLIDLDVTSDVEGLDPVITEVLWSITGNGMDPMRGTIDTSDPGATPSVEVFGLQPGSYLIELEAISEDGQSACRGSEMFDVTEGVSTEVAVLLRCPVGERFGAVRVNGKFNLCPELTRVVVAPLQTSIGNRISVRAQAEDREDDTIEYAWTAHHGPFGDPSAAATFYTCAATGIDQLTISVTDGGPEDCVDSWTVDVRCVDGSGTGGTGGSGATGGGGGTGGSGAAGGGGGTGGTGGTGGIGGAAGTGGTAGIGGAGGTGAAGGSGGVAGTGGSGATGGSGGVAGTGGSGGVAGTGGSGATGGVGGTGGSGATGGTGGTGGGSGTGGSDGGICEITVSLTKP